MARGRPKKAVDRFEEGRTVDNLSRLDERFDNPAFNEEQIRQNLQMEYQTPLYVNLQLKPDDVVYKWGTETIYGMSDTTSLIEYSRQGWTPVPIQRHPEFWIDERIDNGATMKSGIIRVKGAILLQRSKALEEIARKRSEEENMRSLDMANRMEKPNGLMPIGMNPSLKTNSVSISRNRSFN